MSPFTDDDLKRLKADHKGRAYYIPTKGDHVSLWAILARLEAAEKCIESWEDALKNNECDWCISRENDDNETEHMGDCEAMCELEAWRKAAGR